MKETRCIICGKERQGLSVRQDLVIKGIRWFKANVTRNEKGYNLVVCKECYPVYAKQRKKFESRQILYICIGVIFAAVLFYASLNKLLALVYGVLVLVFMYIVSLLTYIPELEVPGQATGQAKKGAKPPKASETGR